MLLQNFPIFYFQVLLCVDYRQPAFNVRWFANHFSTVDHNLYENHCYNNLYPPQELGGYGRCISDFVWGLLRNGHEIMFLHPMRHI